MAFDNLTAKLQNVFKGLRSKGRLTEADVKAALREVKMALLEADVNFKSIQIYAKLSMYPIVLGCKNTLVNLKKNSIIYATIYYYVFICRRSNEGGG